MNEPVIFLEPQKVEAHKENVNFIGGSLDGQTKEATIHAKMKGVIITLKNKEQYKYEEPLTMRFIGMKQASEIITRHMNWKQRAFSKIVKWLNG